jgi:plastocyanin
LANHVLTINASSMSPNPLDVNKGDTVQFVAGTGSPSSVTISSSSLFGHGSVPVPSTQTVKSNAHGNYTVTIGGTTHANVHAAGGSGGGSGTIIVSN